MADKNTARQTSLEESLCVDGYEEVETQTVEKECPEAQLELNAPAQKLWYHGRLDRQTAEERLLNNNEEGNYLIRESESKPGSFVLSYHGTNHLISHFRIISLCGNYYIGGRQFDSLSDLIGYYTAWSCLLKGEQLKYPVPPPQPVDDRRKVVALLSYRQLPDTDEISFEKGDLFVVCNELKDGWLWVTSLTGQSGLVPAALMENLDSSIDPVEALPYFHGNITKEIAVQRLQRAGEGSFLVRPSDNSPGDYVLFFLCDKEVLRYRIQNKTSFLWLGGRCFQSLQAIVERYTKEEIVDGYKLITPVHRNTLSSQQTNDIYASIPQSSGPNLLSSLDESQSLKGYLSKRSERTKRWKSMYFILNGTESHLLYFENEKRSKPKGLVEFNYSSLYPVHDSFFERPNCFQLVSEYNNNNNVQICYLCAENGDSAQKWYQELKNHCENTRKQKSVLKKFCSLTIKIIDAQRLQTKLFHHPYCCVSLDNVKVCRTQVSEDKQVFWGEEFLLDDIPTTTEKFSITVCNKGKRNSTDIAHVTVNLSELENTDMIEQKYMLQPCNSTYKGDLGTLRVKASYSQEIIMPQEEYTSLKELLLSDNFKHLIALAGYCQANEWIPLSKACLRIYRYERLENQVLNVLNDLEIEKEEEVSTLFRATSFTTTMMDQYMRMTCTPFVHAAVKNTVQKIMDSKQSCELDPAKMETPSEAKVNVDNLLHLLNETVEGIFKSTDSCPHNLRQICHHLQLQVTKRWPTDETVKTRVISGFIFLRLLCPAILNPKSFNLVAENPSEMSGRTLKLVAKVIQNLANLVDTGTKEVFMEVVKPFIKKNRDKMIMYLDELSNIQSVHPVKQENIPVDLARDLATVHQMAATHLQDLRKLSETQPCLRKLVAVTDMLTDHKSKYIEKNS
ncbi:hypothetical protein SNE40_011238 [Patella caerulea]|uniref:Ras GTPase-activating protein 1 n=1 Tax=Patella caerulea TaxID=87958 RepID=A0AAN8JJB4_PATCE